MVHGAGAAQALLRAGQIDEMEIHLSQVLLGSGRRLFERLPPGYAGAQRPGRRRRGLCHRLRHFLALGRVTVAAAGGTPHGLSP
jgi:hypothetical protein